jgi:hypothetical protein
LGLQRHQGAGSHVDSLAATSNHRERNSALPAELHPPNGGHLRCGNALLTFSCGGLHSGRFGAICAENPQPISWSIAAVPADLSPDGSGRELGGVDVHVVSAWMLQDGIGQPEGEVADAASDEVDGGWQALWG